MPLFVWLFDLILLLKCHDSVDTNTSTLARIRDASTSGQEETFSLVVVLTVEFMGKFECHARNCTSSLNTQGFSPIYEVDDK